MNKELRDKESVAYGYKEALPELRSMYPSCSRGQMVIRFSDAWRAGFDTCNAEVGNKYERLQHESERLVNALEYIWGTYANDNVYDPEVAKQNYVNLIRTIREAKEAVTVHRANVKRIEGKDDAGNTEVKG